MLITMRRDLIPVSADLGVIQKSIEDGNRATTKSIDSLTSAISTMASSITTGFQRAEVRAAQAPHSETIAQRVNGSSTGISLSNVLLIVGSLATVGLVMISSNSSSIQIIDKRMESDNVRERTDAAATATLNESLKEVETQFTGVSDLMDILEDRINRVEYVLSDHNVDVSSLNADQSARINAIERKLYGEGQ